jgi:hypothetical protein
VSSSQKLRGWKENNEERAWYSTALFPVSYVAPRLSSLLVGNFESPRSPSTRLEAGRSSLLCLLPFVRLLAMAQYEPLDVEDGDGRRDSESPLLADKDVNWLTTASRRERTLETQRSALLALVFVLVLALAAQSVVHHRATRPPLPPPPRPPPPAAPSLAPPQLELRPSLPSSRYDDLNQGRWEAPSRVWTKETVVEVWGSPALNAGHMRTTELSAFEWRPEGGVHDWDTFEFLKRMYNSQKGLLLVGGESPFLRHLRSSRI